MKPSILVGVVIAIIILAIVIFAPPGLRSGAAKAAEEAQAQAALAERLLYRHSVQMSTLERLVSPAAFKDVQAQALYEQAKTGLTQINQEYSKLLSRMKSDAEADKLPAPTVSILPASPAGVEQAIKGYQNLLKEDLDRLTSKDGAIGLANGAKAIDASALGVQHVLGMSLYTRAAELLSAAQDLRRQQQLAQVRLLLVASQWKAYQANSDYLVGLDVRDILSKLRTDLADVRDQNQAASDEATKLAAAVTEREQALAKVRQDLKAGRDELLGIERQGFVAGQDDSFNAYREKYVAVSSRLRALEEEEQLLDLGGFREPKFDGEDVETAKISGTEVIGLQEMQRKLAAAQEKAKRLGEAVAALEKHIGFVDEAGNAANKGQGDYAKLLDELSNKQKEIVPQILKLQAEASKKETEAMQAASEAASAFEASQQSADKWVSGARELRQNADPEGKNAWLARITSDPTFPQFGKSAKAAALTLKGRICAQRIDGNQSLLDDISIFGAMRPGAGLKPEEAQKYKDEIDTARDSGKKALDDATKIYAALEKASSGTKWSWVSQAGLASAYYLAARISPADAEELLTKARESAEAAVKDRENSPYLAAHVQFRDFLKQATIQKHEPVEGESGTGTDEQPAGGEK